MMHTLKASVAAILVAGSASAATVDFESLGAELGETGTITDAALADYGFTLRINDSELATIGQTGGERTSFYGVNSIDNGHDSLYGIYARNIGDYFVSSTEALTPDDGVTLSILYDDAQSFFGIDVIDVDMGESYEISFYDAAGALLGSQTVDGGSAGAGNGAAVSFSEVRDTADIARVDILGQRGRNRLFGFGFDNISYDFGSVAPVPIPFSAALLLGGLGALGVAGRRRKA
ncbi:hypothetical protein ACMA5I_13375 [Paracoccaceae bacterium GXU_MW_L88]